MEKQIIKYRYINEMALNKLRIYIDREEFEQIGLIALWRALSTYDENKGPLEQYLYMYVRFNLMKELKRKYRLMEKEIQEELLFYYMEDPYTQVNKKLEYVQELISYLKEEERLLITAIYFDQLKAREVAQILCISEDAVKKRKKRILNKLFENWQIHFRNLQ